MSKLIKLNIGTIVSSIVMLAVVISFLLMGIVRLCNYVVLLAGSIILIIAIVGFFLKVIIKFWQLLFKKNSENATKYLDLSKYFENIRSFLMDEMVVYTKRPFLFAICFIFIILIALFVWPTMYRYDHMIVYHNTYPVRINRLTGNSEILSGSNGWISLNDNSSSKESNTNANISKKLSQTISNKIDGNLLITNYGQIHADIYNGTDNTIKSIIIQITVTNANGNITLSRKYKLDSFSWGGGSLRSTDYEAPAGFKLEQGDDFTWSIVDVEYK
jgi:hypothetical protein